MVAQAGAALGQTVGTRVNAVAPRDTVVARKQGTGMVMVRVTAKIDSLVRALNALPVGSPEYARTQDSLNAAISAGLPRGTPTGGETDFTIHITAPPRAGTITMRDITPRGWMGMSADGINTKWSTPSGQFVHYLEYPTVVDVEPNSPAAKVGVRFGDTLVAYDGLDLRRTPINLTRLLEPGRKVTVRLRRDGDMNDLAMIIERAPASLESERRADAVGEMLVPSRAPRMVYDSLERRLVEGRAIAMAGPAGGGSGSAPTPRVRMGGTMVASAVPTGLLGAAMTDVDATMAESLVGMKGKVGVLVTNVPGRSLAERMGLKRGDVILRVENGDVASTSYLRFRLQQMEMQGVERVQITIMRAGKTQALTLETPR